MANFIHTTNSFHWFLLNFMQIFNSFWEWDNTICKVDAFEEDKKRKKRKRKKEKDSGSVKVILLALCLLFDEVKDDYRDKTGSTYALLKKKKDWFYLGLIGVVLQCFELECEVATDEGS